MKARQVWPKIALGMWSLCLGSQLWALEPYDTLAKKDFGTASDELVALEKTIQSAPVGEYPAIEAGLLSMLESPAGSVPGKITACQLLKLVGTAKSVPALSKLLTDERLSHQARNTLLSLTDASVDAALQAAVAGVSGKTRAGIINTLGDRGQASALKVLAGELSSTDELILRASLNAIGRIGGVEAAEVLEKTATPASVEEARASASLQVALSLMAQGQESRAESLVKTLVEKAVSPATRDGAFVALVKIQKEAAIPAILERLLSKDLHTFELGETAGIAVPGNAATVLLAKALDSQSPEGKVAILSVLHGRGDRVGILEMVHNAALDSNADVSLAAIKSLGRLGDASSVAVLVKTLKTSDGAVSSLNALFGAEVPAALAAELEKADAPVREKLLGVLADRNQVEALPAIRKLVGEPTVAVAALKALATLGTQEDFETLLKTYVGEAPKAEREKVVPTLLALARRLPADPMAEAVLPTLAKVEEEARKTRLLEILSTCGGSKAYAGVKEMLSAAGDLRKAAIRTLGNWNSGEPMAELLKIAKEETEMAPKLLALRGYIRLAGVQDANDKSKLKSFTQAAELVTRPDEKKLILTGLSELVLEEALKSVHGYVDDPVLANEAWMAYCKIGESLVKKKPVVAKAALSLVIEKAADKNLRSRAQKAMDKIKA